MRIPKQVEIFDEIFGANRTLKRVKSAGHQTSGGNTEFVWMYGNSEDDSSASLTPIPSVMENKTNLSNVHISISGRCKLEGEDLDTDVFHVSFRFVGNKSTVFRWDYDVSGDHPVRTEKYHSEGGSVKKGKDRILTVWKPSPTGSKLKGNNERGDYTKSLKWHKQELIDISDKIALRFYEACHSIMQQHQA